MNDGSRCGAAVRLRAELLDGADPAWLEPFWVDLEARADGSFFQSSGWIGCWLRHLPAEVRPRPLIVRAEDGRVVGLAVLADRRTTRRAGLIRPRGRHLSETSDPRYDVIAIEYNGFLADRRLTEEAVRPDPSRGR